MKNLDLDQYRTEGVVHLPQGLSPEDLSLAEAAFSWSLANPGPVASRLYQDGMQQAVGVAEAREFSAAEPGFFYQDIGNPAAFDNYHSLLMSDSVQEVLQCLFPGSVRFLGEQVFLKEGAPPTGWHQDTADLNVRGAELAVLWMSFDSLPKDQCLEVVRGSHLGPVYSSIYGAYRASPIPDVEAARDQFDIASWACDPGDLMIFHPGCLHGGAGMPEGSTRKSLALRFVGEGCTTSESQGAAEPADISGFPKVR